MDVTKIRNPAWLGCHLASSSINLSCLRAVFTTCTSFKPLCRKKVCPEQWSRKLVQKFLSTVFSVALPFHRKPGAIRNYLKTPPFFRGLVWCPGFWRQRESWNLAHAQAFFSPDYSGQHTATVGAWNETPCRSRKGMCWRKQDGSTCIIWRVYDVSYAKYSLQLVVWWSYLKLPGMCTNRNYLCKV